MFFGPQKVQIRNPKSETNPKRGRSRGRESAAICFGQKPMDKISSWNYPIHLHGRGLLYH
jgi:hypothetical protein